MNEEKLASVVTMVNDCKKIVDESTFGPLINIVEGEELKVKKMVNPVAFQIYSILLSEMVKGRI